MKAILEFDLPKSCESCRLNVECACYAFETVALRECLKNKRASFCPLKYINVSTLIEDVEQLQSENAALKERLKKALDIVSIFTGTNYDLECTNNYELQESEDNA